MPVPRQTADPHPEAPSSPSSLSCLIPASDTQITRPLGERILNRKVLSEKKEKTVQGHCCWLTSALESNKVNLKRRRSLGLIKMRIVALVLSAEQRRPSQPDPKHTLALLFLLQSVQNRRSAVVHKKGCHVNCQRLTHQTMFYKMGGEKATLILAAKFLAGSAMK